MELRSPANFLCSPVPRPGRASPQVGLQGALQQTLKLLLVHSVWDAGQHPVGMSLTAATPSHRPERLSHVVQMSSHPWVRCWPHRLLSGENGSINSRYPGDESTPALSMAQSSSVLPTAPAARVLQPLLLSRRPLSPVQIIVLFSVLQWPLSYLPFQSLPKVQSASQILLH